jgi:hypothetical protein
VRPRAHDCHRRGGLAGGPIGLTDLGRVRVLRALADSPQLTRSEIVRRTGSARATVGSLLYESMAGAIVREEPAPSTASRNGRPAALVLERVPEALGLTAAGAS